MATPSIRKRDIERRWVLVDVDGLVLGRVASRIAHILKGKHKPTYTPHADMGDHVVVVNAAKVRLTGRKESDKLYHHHSGYVGGLKTFTAAELRTKHPEDLIYNAVRRMLPRSPLGRDLMRKLRVYPGAEHPHVAQQPEAIELPL
jgi:large subunit ribosomal protein L13